MAATSGSHRNKTSTVIILFSTILVLLCAVECRRCYWCGPLADQVHRSRRAPPCLSHGNQMAACEPGRDHCAVVATAPPHVESRFCVKLYQDECYPLYCNTTQSWKMVCPCRGDLCNGANGERENEAFIYLAKLAARTRRFRLRRDTTDELEGQTEDSQTTSYDKKEIENSKVTNSIDKDTAENQPEAVSVTNTATTENQMTTETQPQDLSTNNQIAASSITGDSMHESKTAIERTTMLIKSEPLDETVTAEIATHDNQLPTDETTKDISKITSHSDKNSPKEIIMMEPAMEMADEPITTVHTIVMKETNFPTAEARQEETMKSYETTKIPTPADQHTTVTENRTETTIIETTSFKQLTTKSPKNSASKFTYTISIIITTTICSFVSMFT